MPAFNFQARFAEMVEDGTKRQTIRAFRKDGREPCKIGDTLKLYTGMRTKHCRLLRTATCINCVEILLNREHGFQYVAWEDCALQPVVLEDKALKDGFKDGQDMLDWFDQTHGLPFRGWLISWK